MKTLNLNEEKLRDTLLPQDEELTLTGKVTLEDCNRLSEHELNVLDISGATFGIEEEEWSVGGWSHSGWCGRWGLRDVEVLKRLLEQCNAKKVVLPVEACRRHLNAITRNSNVREVIVSDQSPLFSMKDGDVYNKKGTLLVYKNK